MTPVKNSIPKRHIFSLSYTTQELDPHDNEEIPVHQEIIYIYLYYFNFSYLKNDNNKSVNKKRSKTKTNCCPAIARMNTENTPSNFSI